MQKIEKTIKYNKEADKTRFHDDILYKKRFWKMAMPFFSLQGTDQ